ncbi:MAG: hypothetical protein ABSH20_16245 [Tepidisphaeraceae bacterium]|jgi:acid stress-induced BolA-like protein IbaG/YrbA
MAKLTKLSKDRLERILTTKLSLKDPEFFLEKTGNLLVGNVVSASFKGKGDYARQEMIWNVLDAELGAESSALVGMLLAYTPDEWNLGADEKAAPRRVKKAG